MRVPVEELIVNILADYETARVAIQAEKISRRPLVAPDFCPGRRSELFAENSRVSRDACSIRGRFALFTFTRGLTTLRMPSVQLGSQERTA